MVPFFLGQQGEYTKYTCFFCLWNIRAKEEHYFKQIWPERTSLNVSEKKKVINSTLVSRDKIIFPSLHIKLSYAEQYVKTLDTNCECFKYIT